MHWNKAEILCYECTTTATYENIMKNETAKLCSKFDKIEEYEISCPYSTFCMKKTSELVLADGSKYSLISPAIILLIIVIIN